jgi:hypothetical protein
MSHQKSSFLKSLLSPNKLALITIVSSIGVGAATISYYLYKKYKKIDDEKKNE